jgi:type VI secretion system protein VasG
MDEPSKNEATETEAELGWQPPSNTQLVDLIKPELLKHFAPALLARMKVVPFRPLQLEDLKKIVALKLEAMAHNLANSHKMELRVDQKVLATLAQQCAVSDSGARMVNAVIEQQLMPGIARSLLEFMIEDDMPDILTLSLDENGEIEATFSDRLASRTEQLAV